ncbi:hypothetical protein L6452_06158 [Arctium lappa]|uniref:Uncharacterized protein n=1 Tax=Arctium lappa TaxID=4217 RepID=A0ACB9EJF3_ARCLA|nr:hypothetical protein L6452_06158 [Arctium lappa]
MTFRNLPCIRSQMLVLIFMYKRFDVCCRFEKKTWSEKADDTVTVVIDISHYSIDLVERGVRSERLHDIDELHRRDLTVSIDIETAKHLLHFVKVRQVTGVEFIHATATATATHHQTHQILLPNCDIHPCFKTFFTLDNTLSYAGHQQPIAAVQVTEIGDGVFIGCTVNHAVVNGTSFWNFYNTFAEICKGVKRVTNSPDFTPRKCFYFSSAPPTSRRWTFRDVFRRRAKTQLGRF